MAKEAKISMSESRLMELDGYYHFMTKRFDRIKLNNGAMDKLHMQTLGAIMHRDYNEPGTLSYEEAVQTMYKLGMRKKEMEQFFRRMVFNVMSRNQDDHVKNISFLMDRKGKWYLSPAYDVNYSFNPTGKWTAVHQMIINGKTSNISKEDLLQSAHSMRIDENKASEVINEVKSALLKWDSFAKKANLEKKTIDAIAKTFVIYG